MNLQQLIYEHELKIGDKVNCTHGCYSYGAGIYEIVIFSYLNTKMGILNSEGQQWVGNYPGTRFELIKGDRNE